MPRCTVSLLLSQSTSDHFSARHSDMRSPKQTHSRAMVRNVLPDAEQASEILPQSNCAVCEYVC
jgi:Na+-translocating ferredoxin:NAD+ oxidoreductase RNF subunit RnfB